MQKKDASKILTIDDEAYIRKSIRTYLEDYGFEVFEAENGRAGLEMFDQVRPDLVLLDLRMPEMDGLQVLEILKLKSPDTPLIVASGTGNINSVVEALHLGAWDYILKPVQDMSVLFHSVSKCLKESRLQLENRAYQERLEELVRARTRELKDSEERYKAIFEYTGTATIIVENTGLISMANTRFAELAGLSRSEIEGKKTWEEFVTGEDLAQMKLYHARLVAAGDLDLSQEQFEFRFVRNSGGKRYVSLNVGQIPGTLKFVASLLDITEKKRAEQRWQSLEKQLRKSQKMEAIGTLAGGIAHDLNNILSPILGYADMIMGSTDPEDITFKRSEKIQKAAFRAADLVSQILLFSRRDEEEKKPMRIYPVAKEVLKLLSGSIPSTIRILDRIDTGCGFVEADPTQVHQIIMNLCTNAFHAMEETGGELTVTLNMVDLSAKEAGAFADLKPGRYVRLQVTDTGCGMDESVQERIFDPYYTTKEEGKGTGLGLSIVYSIVKGYQGEVHVKSAPGQGTVFTILLPEVSVTSFQEKDPQRSRLPGKASGEMILVVDDDTAIADMFDEGLKLLGYGVKTVYSSLDALEFFKINSRSVDLVVTDQTMPGKTGFDLAREMIILRPEIPVILCSGHGGGVNAKRAVEAGIRRFVMKPVTVDDLSREIQHALRG
ncbi:MAG: response regulator [Pseudomonadota bacterium]